MIIATKVWGKEEWIANSDKYCGKRLTLRSGWQCSLHMHPIKEETFYVEHGKVGFELDGEERVMLPGDHVHIKPGQWHRFTGLGLSDAIIFEFSTKHSDEDVVRKEPSRMVE